MSKNGYDDRENDDIVFRIVSGMLAYTLCVRFYRRIAINQQCVMDLFIFQQLVRIIYYSETYYGVK